MARDTRIGPPGWEEIEKIFGVGVLGDIRQPLDSKQILTAASAVAPSWSKPNEISGRVGRVDIEAFWVTTNAAEVVNGDIFCALRILGPGDDANSSPIPDLIPLALEASFPLGAFPVSTASVRGFYRGTREHRIDAAEGVQFAIVSSSVLDSNNFFVRFHYSYLGGNGPQFHAENQSR